MGAGSEDEGQIRAVRKNIQEKDCDFFILTAINLFVLIFMCGLVKLSETLNPKQAKGFLATFILIGGISILEMISVLVDDGPGC